MEKTKPFLKKNPLLYVLLFFPRHEHSRTWGDAAPFQVKVTQPNLNSEDGIGSDDSSAFALVRVCCDSALQTLVQLARPSSWSASSASNPSASGMPAVAEKQHLPSKACSKSTMDSR
eukprot:5730918-Amphidinium_carterae.1